MIYAYIFSHYKMTRINKNTDFLGHLRVLSFIPEVQQNTNSVANSEFDVWKSFVFLTRGPTAIPWAQNLKKAEVFTGY